MSTTTAIEVVADATVLHAVVQRIAATVPSRSTLPVLGYLRLLAEQEEVRLTATNVDCWSTALAPCLASEPLDVLLDAAVLKGLLASLSGEVRLEAEGERLTARWGRTGRLLIPTLPVDEFPLFNRPVQWREVASLSAPALHAALKLVRPHIRGGTDASVLQSVCFKEIGGKLTVTACDRSSAARVELAECATGWEALLPPLSVAAILPLLSSSEEEVRIFGGGDDEAFTRFLTPSAECDARELSSAIGPYPDITSILQAQPVNAEVDVRRDALAGAVRRVVVVSERDSVLPIVRFHTSGEDTLVVRDDDGRALEELDTGEQSGEFDHCYPARRLAEMLASQSGERALLQVRRNAQLQIRSEREQDGVLALMRMNHQPKGTVA